MFRLCDAFSDKGAICARKRSDWLLFRWVESSAARQGLRRDPDATGRCLTRPTSSGTTESTLDGPFVAFATASRGLALGLQRASRMSSGIWAAASGAVGQVAQLDTAANNLANLETPGYRVDRMVFRRALEGSIKGYKPHETLEASVVRSVSHEMRAGRVVPTGRHLDVALSDDNAFFAVETPQGVRYTRAGSLHVMPDGAITGPSGIPYLGPGMRPLYVPPGATNVDIDNTGQISVDGEPDGQSLLVVKFPQFEQLRKEGNVLLHAPREAGPAEQVWPAYLQTGALEKSTDHAFQFMSEVTTSSRNFEMLTQVIEAFSNIEERTARDIFGR